MATVPADPAMVGPLFVKKKIQINHFCYIIITRKKEVSRPGMKPTTPPAGQPSAEPWLSDDEEPRARCLLFTFLALRLVNQPFGIKIDISPYQMHQNTGLNGQQTLGPSDWCEFG